MTKTMDRETREAVDGSIAKWEAIVAGTHVERGIRDCPLCGMFKTFGHCGDCPVRQKTQQHNCHGSPYDLWVKVRTHDLAVTPEQFAAAQAMLEFLKSLLPEGEI
jgi:hypothetical protein